MIVNRFFIMSFIAPDPNADHHFFMPSVATPLFDSNGCNKNTYSKPEKELCPSPQSNLPSLDGSFTDSSSTTNPTLSQGNVAVENSGLIPNPLSQSPDSQTATLDENPFPLPALDSNYVIPAFKPSLLSPSLNLGNDNNLYTPLKQVASFLSNPDDDTAGGYFNQGGSFGRRRRRAVEA